VAHHSHLLEAAAFFILMLTLKIEGWVNILAVTYALRIADKAGKFSDYPKDEPLDRVGIIGCGWLPHGRGIGSCLAKGESPGGLWD